MPLFGGGVASPSDDVPPRACDAVEVVRSGLGRGGDGQDDHQGRNSRSGQRYTGTNYENMY